MKLWYPTATLHDVTNRTWDVHDSEYLKFRNKFFNNQELKIRVVVFK